jgi:hypothetical protein
LPRIGGDEDQLEQAASITPALNNAKDVATKFLCCI